RSGKRIAPNAIRSPTPPRLRALVPEDFQHPGGASSASDSAPGARRTVGAPGEGAQADRDAEKRSQREKPSRPSTRLQQTHGSGRGGEKKMTERLPFRPL